MREISIANRHPRLRLNRREVARVFELLDAWARDVTPPPRPDTAVPSSPQRRRARSADAPCEASVHSSRPERKTAPAIPPGELSIVFLTDAALAQLHADFLADPTTTDVITFEGQAALGTAGEICVSADTADRYAREHGRKFAEELTLYLVHGWLHLAGFDDLVPAKKRAMRRAEARAMKLLRCAQGLPGFQLRKK